MNWYKYLPATGKLPLPLRLYYFILTSIERVNEKRKRPKLSRWLTVEEYAKHIGVSKTTIYKKIRAHQIPPSNVSHRLTKFTDRRGYTRHRSIFVIRIED